MGQLAIMCNCRKNRNKWIYYTIQAFSNKGGSVSPYELLIQKNWNGELKIKYKIKFRKHQLSLENKKVEHRYSNVNELIYINGRR
jgi:hypothetical protein